MVKQRRAITRKRPGQSRALARKKNGARTQMAKRGEDNTAGDMQSKENLAESSSSLDEEKSLYICFVIQEETMNVDIF